MNLFRKTPPGEKSPEKSRKEKPGLFSGLSKSRGKLAGGLFGLLGGGRSIDESLFDEIQDNLLLADVGVAASECILERVRQAAKAGRVTTAEQLLEVVRESLVDMLESCEGRFDDEVTTKPAVILMVGVNGVGKTTTLAKIASRLSNEGASVMMAACDTFRAAAIEQLQEWGSRLDIPVIAQSHGADAAAVAFDSLSAATARGTDYLLIDTAGRQHTHGDLMEQLKKVKRVLAKGGPGIPAEVLLTVDAGNGQNVLSQVEHFHEAVGLTGLCVTKLDGTARGGVVLAMADRFNLPVYYIGVGEGVDDLKPFRAREFVDALLPETLAGGE